MNEQDRIADAKVREIAQDAYNGIKASDRIDYPMEKIEAFALLAAHEIRCPGDNCILGH